jgi:hypothetical protein
VVPEIVFVDLIFLFFTTTCIYFDPFRNGVCQVISSISVASVLWSLATLLIHAMKRLLTKASKPFEFSSTPQTDRSSPPILLSNPTAPHTTGLQPKFVVPAVPQPYPHRHLAILVTKEGLLIRPHVFESGIDQKEGLPCVRVSWGKSVKVEEIEEEGSQLSEKLDWNEAVIVYGIVGILELFSCSFS